MGTILVVDDEPRMRDLLRAMLAGQYKVCVASSGGEALMAMEMSRPDLIILDVAMPEMDGIQFLRVLRDTPEWAQTPVMLLTAFATPDQHHAAGDLGVCEQWTKASFSVRDLRKRIAECLNEGAGPRAEVAAGASGV
jgi:putative two-component system response regulator